MQFNVKQILTYANNINWNKFTLIPIIKIEIYVVYCKKCKHTFKGYYNIPSLHVVLEASKEYSLSIIKKINTFEREITS